MTPTLDITNLIQRAEEMVYDGRIENAHSGEITIQEFTSDSGDKYKLKLVMERVIK